MARWTPDGQQDNSRQQLLARAAAERQMQQAAAEELMRPWPLPVELPDKEAPGGDFLVLRLCDGHDESMFLPAFQEAFSVTELRVSDMAQARFTELLATYNRFKQLLDSLAREDGMLSMQILVKSVSVDLKTRVERAQDRAKQFEENSQHLVAAWAHDYSCLLDALNREKCYVHRYYVVLSCQCRDGLSPEGAVEKVEEGTASLLRQVQELSEGSVAVYARVMRVDEVKRFFSEYYDLEFSVLGR